MTARHRPWLVASLSASLTLAACGTSGEEPPAPSPSTPAPTADPTTASGMCTAIFPVHDSQGREIPVTSRLSTSTARVAVANTNYAELPTLLDTAYSPDVEFKTALAPLANGQILTTLVGADGPYAEGKPGPGGVPGLFDDGFTPLPTSPDDDGVTRLADAGSAVGDRFVWRETSTESDYASDWVIYTATAAAPTPAKLADSTSVTEDGIVPRSVLESEPQVGASLAFWTSPYPLANAETDVGVLGYNSKVLAHRLDGQGDLAMVADHAFFPSADGDTVYFARDGQVDGGLDLGTYEILASDQLAPERLVARGQQGFMRALGGVSAQGGVVTWVIAGSKPDATLPPRDEAPRTSAAGCAAVYVLNTRTMTLTVIESEDDLGFSPHVAGGAPILTWTRLAANDSRVTYLFDTKAQSLWRLPGSTTVEPINSVNADRFIWTTQLATGFENLEQLHNSRWIGAAGG